MAELMQWSPMRRALLLLIAATLALAWSIQQHIAADVANPPQATAAETTIDRLQAQLREQSDASSGSAAGAAAAFAQLGLAYLQRVRETDDPSLYSRAEAAFTEALAREPGQIDALVGRGMLALSRHDFPAALAWGEQARQANPYRAAALGVLVDAHVELGDYAQAVVAAQQMVNLRPDLASYSRVSYLRELHGDTPGAIAAMQTAIASGVPGREETLWAQYQLGRLHFNSGDWPAAEAVYQEALRLRLDYPYAQAGLAEVMAARGEYGPALAILEPLVERRPLPAFAMLLGDVYQVIGRAEEAQRTYQLVEALQQLNIAAGMDVDLEMALFSVDRGGDPVRVVELARSVYQKRPTIYAADALAWALYRAGSYEEAADYSRQALRLGTRDALLHYHAGMIALALGDDLQAERFLREALAINPAFSLLHAPEAKKLRDTRFAAQLLSRPSTRLHTFHSD